MADKLEMLLQSMGISSPSIGTSSPSSAKTQGLRHHHSPFHTHDSHRSHSFHNQDFNDHTPKHSRRLHPTPTQSSSPQPSTLIPSMQEQAGTPFSLITGDDVPSGTLAKGRASYSPSVPRRQLRGLPPLIVPEKHHDGGGVSKLEDVRQDGGRGVAHGGQSTDSR